MEGESVAGQEEAPSLMNPALEAALAHKRPRYFRASDGSAKGKTGDSDTERFGADLMAYQECAQIVGEKLEMHSISYGVVYDGDETVCFRFDPNSDPMNPELIGAIVNRRMPMRQMLGAVNEHMNL